VGPANQHGRHPSIGASVYDIVKDLHADVESLTFPIPVENADEAREQRSLLLAQLEDHLLPRLAELSMPAVVVIAGSTGAGKSTLTNSIVGEEVSPASLLRPTTVEPVLVVNPRDRELMEQSTLAQSVKITEHNAIPRGIAILDAPDLDSVRDDNRATARRLLESADLWLFVTTARRYGDALPWKTLTSATARGTSVAMILNRAPKDSLSTVRIDLLRRLAEHSMEKTPLFVIEDLGPHEGLLPEKIVKPVRTWLATLSGADQARAVIVRTLRGALEALPPRLIGLATATDTQVAATGQINAHAKETLMASVAQIRESIVENELLSGAGEAQWSLLETASRYDKLIGRNGYAKASSTLRKRRSEAAERALAGFKQSAQAVGADSVEAARNELTRALKNVPGGQFVEVSEFPVRTLDVTATVATWQREHSNLVETFLKDHTSKQVAAATRALDTPSIQAITMAAALGIAPAQELARRLLGNEVQPVIEASTAALADAYDQLILGEYQHVCASLDALGLTDGASARIRVRVAELRKLR